MEKMFVHIAKKASFTTALQTKYTNSIVFIKDTQEIWTHGTFYAIPDTYKTKITDLQSAVLALQAIYAFTTISDGTNTAAATATAKTIKFTGEGATTVSVSADGVKISTPADTLVTGTDNGTVKFNNVDVAVKGLGDAAYQTKKYFDDAIADAKKAGTDAQTAANGKVANVTAASNSGIAITGTATAPIVGLKLDATTPGNVTLSQGANGLKANVVIPSATVTGVVASDKVLGLNGTLLSATLGLEYDSTAKLIKLVGIDDEVIASINAADFIKDGMVNAVSFNPTNKKLTITFNTDSGQEDIEVDLSALVDTYTAGNGISISNNVISVKTDSASESFLSVGTGGIKLSGILDAIDEAKTAVIGVSGDAASANTVYGAKKYADGLAGNYATKDQGTKADTALQSIAKGTDGSYVTTTIGAKSNNSLTVATSVTVQAISSASTSAKGLAEASDVKTYVDNLFAWEEL